MTDFAELLYRSLPGIHRQKDEQGHLRAFLSIMASPLTELENSIDQLYEDFFASSARGELLPLVGSLIGAELDPTLPPTLQRAALEETFALHRSKGLSEPLRRTVEAYTGWTTVAIDYSQVVARLPFLDNVNPVVRRRDQPMVAGEDATVHGAFHMDASRRVVQLYDEQTGRPLTRADIDTRPVEIVGTVRGFAIRDRGADIVGLGSSSGWTAIGADLTNFASPLGAGGSALTLEDDQVAIDPVLGRLLFAADGQPPAAGDLSVDFHELAPPSMAPQTLDIRDGRRMLRIGRSDDPAPYTVDIRSSEHPRDRAGRSHSDNHGVFLTVSRRFENQRPTRSSSSTRSQFTFDTRARADGTLFGDYLLLLDGIDGRPIARRALRERLDLLVDTPRGFSIQARGVSLRDPSFGATLVAANLHSAQDPRDPEGAPLTLGRKDIAIDPFYGSFSLELGAFDLTVDDLRVSYLVAPARRHLRIRPHRVGAPPGNVFTFSPDGAAVILVDDRDGIALSARRRMPVSGEIGSDRGIRVRSGDIDLTATYSRANAALPNPTQTVPAGTMYVDLERARFALPADVAARDDLTVDFSTPDHETEERVFASLLQRLPRLVPAGTLPVVVDTRRPIFPDHSILFSSEWT